MGKQRTIKTYFLLAVGTGLVKIGCSNDPIGRMSDLRTMNAVQTEPLYITRVEELILHKQFASTRHHGEWFRIDKNMVEYFHLCEEPRIASRLELEMQNESTR